MHQNRCSVCVIVWMQGSHVMMKVWPGLWACSAGPGPGVLQLAMFCAECFGRPVSQEGAGRRCDSCVGHGYSDLHTSSWWIIKAITMRRTCGVGMCRTDYSLVMIWSHTILISLFLMLLPTATWQPGICGSEWGLSRKGKQTKKGSGLPNAATDIKRRVIMATQKQTHNWVWYFIYVPALTNGLH